MAGEHALLDAIRTPADLRALPPRDLPALAAELRAFLLDSVSATGGHLASNLGTVELTIALHHLLDTPEDRIVWDVGHQTYAHKVLTGRREAMSRLRMSGGVSGFPRREESPYDTFGTGHSSTAISAALGMALAARQLGHSRRVVAVVGDGALSAGLAFEALNNAGVSGADLLVILNDNEMSISPAVGAMNRHLSDLVHGGAGAPTFFGQLGLAYDGPVDGHDLDVLLPALRRAIDGRGPRVLHVLTRKGHGYTPAERDPVRYHGVGRFDPAAGLGGSGTAGPRTYTQVFGEWLCDMAAADPRLVAITPAMREGSGLVEFAARHPDRYHDVGIAEQHAVTFAAGLACEGLKPVVAIYSTFLQRAYDQLVHDVQLQNLPVLFAIDRGGLVGADGATHHGAFDLSYLRCIPNMTIMTPADEAECRRMLTTGFLCDGPAAVRYPRGSGPGVPVSASLDPIPRGRAEMRRRGRCVALLVFGTLLDAALDVAEDLDATVVNMRFVKPLDVETVLEVANGHELLVTVEENVVMGGAGSAVAECLAAYDVTVPMLHLGLPDRFIEHGDAGRLAADTALSREAIAAAVRRRLGPRQATRVRAA